MLIQMYTKSHGLTRNHIITHPHASTHESTQDDDEEDEDNEDEDGLGVVGKDPVPCLIMGEVMPGFKCVSPKRSDKWVTLWELNKMRRNEPEKISALW